MILRIFSVVAAIVEWLALLAFFTTKGDIFQILYLSAIWLICIATIGAFLFRSKQPSVYIYIHMASAIVLALLFILSFSNWFGGGYQAVAEEWRDPNENVARIFVCITIVMFCFRAAKIYFVAKILRRRD
jgi:hypothetical protein